MRPGPNDPFFLLAEMLRALDAESDVEGDYGDQPNAAMRFEMEGGCGRCDSWKDRAEAALEAAGLDWRSTFGWHWEPRFGWGRRRPTS